ncbi:RING-H2 finger protein ATL57 [Acorus gramineus]|uniref:RING-H2 finger protein ATL57 n=1 Tax=Acorus gramineus TaxID=55184 RepID=A0AAV8ZX05_ACOGR|nr:RING-H2 finger protein ATL57 [Acorus gramineus]
MDERSSFHISLQRLMAQSPTDLETQLVDRMNNSISNGDRFNGYAGFISDCIHRVVSTLGPEHHGLKVWVKLDKFIVQSRYREETIFSVVGEEEEELESVRYGGNGGIADEEEVCPVCLKSLVFGEEIKRTPCGHLYHSECIFSWLKRSHTCPVCRFEF